MNELNEERNSEQVDRMTAKFEKHMYAKQLQEKDYKV